MSLLMLGVKPISELLGLYRTLLDFDFYVVDETRLRIAGTGVYSRMLGVVLPQNSSNAHTLETKQPFVMLAPGEDPVCLECPMHLSDNCARELSIHVPIWIFGDVAGVLSLSSYYTEESKHRLRESWRFLQGVLLQLSAQLSALIQDKVRLKSLETALQKTNDWTVISDEEGNILHGSNGFYEAFPSCENLYEFLPKRNYTYGRAFSEELLSIHDRMQVRRTKIPLGQQRYHQLFQWVSPKETWEEDFVRSGNERFYLSKVIGKSASITEMKEMIYHVAKYDSNCLILGESGTGKETFARLIHDLSQRHAKPFLSINCAAIPEHLIESQLFGYVGGSFTGADKKGKMGLFEAGNHGTIFLDEIGDMPLHLQPKLLRAIESRRITPVGSSAEIELDVRFIAATNSNLTEKIHRGQFRNDLYYRLCVVLIQVPPLRERIEDIPELAAFFIDKFNYKFHKSVEKLSEEAKKRLLLYDWPGNVRELENIMEYAVSMEKTSSVTLTSLPGALYSESPGEGASDPTQSLDEFKRRQLSLLLEKYGRSVEAKERIAAEMGLSRATLYRQLKKYRLSGGTRISHN